jgi:hypothetical protein
MADIFIWNLYKFDISPLAGEVVTDAKVRLHLNSESIVAPAEIGVRLWRAQSANTTDDQDWSTADEVGKLYDDICEYTRSNEAQQDRLVFGSTSASQYYEWDVTQGVLDALADGDTYFTAVLSRDTTQTSGTKTKGSATSVQHALTRGGTDNQHVTWATSDAAQNQPYLEYTVEPPPKKKGGRTKKRRRLIVEIDNQFFDVNSPEEARILLEQAVELVEEKPARVKKKPKVRVRTLSGRKSRSKVVEKAVKRAEVRLARIFTPTVDFTDELKRKADEEDAIMTILLL